METATNVFLSIWNLCALQMCLEHDKNASVQLLNWKVKAINIPLPNEVGK